jgi:hypothetical protein
MQRVADNARDAYTGVDSGSTWFDYEIDHTSGVNSVPAETGVGTSTLIWVGSGPANARSRLVSD